MITYAKLKKTGEWALRGPISEMKVGKVMVTRKDGDVKIEEILALSKVFEFDGEDCCFGFLEQRNGEKDSESGSKRKEFKKSLVSSASKLPQKRGGDEVQTLVEAAKIAVLILRGVGISHKPLEDALKAFEK